MADIAVQLSCEQCKQRKTKCDKASPCSSCRVNGLICRPVQRARLPRGKTGKARSKNTALESKVARLENLVGRLEAQAQAHTDIPTNHSLSVNVPTNGTRSGKAQSVQYGNKIENFVARDFWMALVNEVSLVLPSGSIPYESALPFRLRDAELPRQVSGLRETLEYSDDEDEPPTTSQPQPDLRKSSQLTSHSLIFGSGLSFGHGALPYPSPSMRSKLLLVYRERVDCLLKVLHWPTFCTSLKKQTTNIHDQSNSRAVQALEYAVYFLSLCSVGSEECEHLQLGNRALLIEQYRMATEMLLSEANLLTTTDLTLLQAFVIYLAAIRCSVNAATTWTLLALAVRIADACGLGSDNLPAPSALEAEVRRRVWFSIGLLDSQTAFGRGSEPLLSHENMKSPPANINDAEMTLNSVPVASKSSFTDMSFACLTHHAMICQRKLVDPSYGSWRDRLDTAASFEVFVNQNFAQFKFSDNPLQRYTAFGSKDMATSMHLLIRRPPYKNSNNAIPLGDDYDVVDAACRILQSGLFKHTSVEFSAFSWFSWPKWYALAVVLVELCSHPKGSKFDQAFEVAQQSYANYAQSASDAHSGLLWKPISKVMRRLQKMVGSANNAPGADIGKSTAIRRQEQTSSRGPDGPVSINISESNVLPNATIGDDQLMSNDELGMVDEAPWYEWDSFLCEVPGWTF